MQRGTVRSVAIGLLGLIVGLIIGVNAIGGVDTSSGGGVSGLSIGVPEFLIIGMIVLFIGFWVVLFGGVVWGIGRFARGSSAGRLEDLPADFDDWHRRAHERMRESGADDPDRRG